MSQASESLASYIKRSIKTLHKRKLEHVDDVGILWSYAPNEEKEAWVRRGMELLQIPYLEFRGVLPPREFMAQLKTLIHRMMIIDTRHLYPGAVVYFPGVPHTQKYHVTGHTDGLLVTLKQRNNAAHPLWIVCVHE